MRTLIIPDLHHHTANAERWLKSQRSDRVIFLGDYFDDFGDNANDARLTAMWLRRRIEQSDDVFLLGNHDAAYLCPESAALYCPGFTQAKARAIHEVLRPEHWRRLRLATVEQGWLISHAGFHPSWIADLTVDELLETCERALRNAAWGVVDPILGIGRDRSGLQAVGGPLWMDWGSLVPIPGIHQIVGHTPGAEVREKTTHESKNYCLDVRNGDAAAVICDGEISILS